MKLPKPATVASSLLTIFFPFAVAVDAAEPADVGSTSQATDAALIGRFFDDALHSSNLRLRVLVGRSFKPTDDLQSMTTFTPIDELAEQARGSTDPMVLALLIEPCAARRAQPKPTCDALDLATRWTVADTQNQLAWIALSSVLQRRGDLAGSRTALERASRVSTWHEYIDEGARTIASAIPAGLGPQARLAALEVAISIPIATLFPSGFQTMAFHCKKVSLRDACATIVDKIVNDRSSMLSRQVAIGIGRRMGTDAALTAARTRSLEALQGASMHATQPFGATADPRGGDPAAALATMERRVRLGEIGWCEAMLAESGQSEAAAAAAFRREMAALQERAKSD